MGIARMVRVGGWGYKQQLAGEPWIVPTALRGHREGTISGLAYCAGKNPCSGSAVPPSLSFPSTPAGADEDSKGAHGLSRALSERELQVCVCQQGLGLRGQALGE